MKTVAEGYGLKVNRSGMCLCPFHSEKTPSAKIYEDSFHCFGCGVHGDVIKFTQMMFHLEKPIAAIKKLNEDFGLHLEIGVLPSKAEKSEYQERISERKAYEEYDKGAWKTLHDYLWLMREWRKLAPIRPYIKPDNRFIYALHHLDYAEYLCDEYISSDKDGRLAMKICVEQTANFLSRQSEF